MSEAERKALIDAFRGGPARVRAAVGGLGAEAIDFRPFVDAWTIRENIAHLCDAEVYAYARHRKAVAEPGARVDMWDEIKWHERLRYSARDFAAGVTLFEALRLATAALLDLVADEDWNGYHIDHPARGRMTLGDLAAFFRDHDAFHFELIERNKRLFREKKG